MEDIDSAHPRELSKAELRHREELARLRRPPKACRECISVVSRRVSRLFDELAQACVDGTSSLALRRFARAQVMILDDFGLEPPHRRDLLEVSEDRCRNSSTLVTSQLGTDQLHAVIGDATNR